jgi:AcrR family transcriptional regulator
MAESLRVAFRRQVRERVLDVAHKMFVEVGWDGVHVGDIAITAGVSRPTLYREFGNKQGLGEALAIREVERFVAGLVEVMEQSYPTSLFELVERAVRFTLDEADVNPLLHDVFTATRSGGTFLPIVTVRSRPLLENTTAALEGWVAAKYPELNQQALIEGLDALIRLTVSHLILPIGDRAETARQLATLAGRYHGLVPPPD